MRYTGYCSTNIYEPFYGPDTFLVLVHAYHLTFYYRITHTCSSSSSPSSSSASKVPLLDEGLPLDAPHVSVLCCCRSVVTTILYYVRRAFGLPLFLLPIGSHLIMPSAQLLLALAAWPAQFHLDVFSICRTLA